MSISGQGHSLTLVKGHSDFKVKCLNFGLYTQVSDSGPLGPLVIIYQSPGSNIFEMFDTGIKVPERQVRFNVNLKHLRLTKFYHFISVHDILKPGPEVVKLFLCSTQLSMKF